MLQNVAKILTLGYKIKGFYHQQVLINNFDLYFKEFYIQKTLFQGENLVVFEFDKNSSEAFHTMQSVLCKKQAVQSVS